MSLLTSMWLWLTLLLGFSGEVRVAVHDELSQCGLSGIYKARQSVLLSPHYPDNYPTSTCWDYVVRSPYRCPTKFHIQFLDFQLESSLNCTNDYLAIGFEAVGDDMDLLCGQVIGIKKYHTPDGILRLRFLSDDSPWTTAKGFKLLITRLACERGDQLGDDLEPPEEEDTDIMPPVLTLQPPLRHPAQPFRNLSTLGEQHRPLPLPPLFGRLPHPGHDQNLFFLPAKSAAQVDVLPLVPPQERIQPTRVQPCSTTEKLPIVDLPVYASLDPKTQQLPQLTDQYPVNSWAPQTSIYRTAGTQFGQTCCATSFQQKRFYLSSPGFPRSAFTSLLPTQQRDCRFQLEKNTQQVCRLRIDFKYFDFGHAYSSSGTVNGGDICTEDFIELDGQRFCGCRTGFVYAVHWPFGVKTLRMRLGYSGLPSPGFLLDIYQEDCELLPTTPYQQQPPPPPQSFFQAPIYLPSAGGPLYSPYQSLPWLNGARSKRDVHILDVVKSHASQQPFSVVETNSTRKEFYYHDGDEAWAQERSAKNVIPPLEPDDPQRAFTPTINERATGQCSFDNDDALRLAADVLWQTKPICYAPQQSWFSNAFALP